MELKDESTHIESVEKLNDAVTTVEYIPTLEEKFPNVDGAKLLRKMDWKLVPMVTLLYLMSFLDRGNIGNANIEGLSEDLGLTGQQFNLCLTVFFFTYCTFEVPSNMILKRLRPSVYLPIIMLCWGTCMTLMGIVTNYHGLLVCRLFLGVTEAGLVPGVAYYLTMWYARKEMQLRQALFFSAAGMAGAFSGLLAFAIAKMRGTAGLAGWKWIFIIEGLATVVVAVIAFFTIQDFPSDAKFLTEEEREYLQYKLKYDGHDRDSAATSTGQHVSLGVNDSNDKKFVWQAFLDPQTWAIAFMIVLAATPIYSISFFLPSIIKNLGHVSSKAQLMSIPVSFTGAITTVVQAYFSDKYGIRYPLMALDFVSAIIGYIMALTTATSHPAVTYAGCFFIVGGTHPAFIAMLSWLSVNSAGTYKRAIALAIALMVGNMSGAVGANIYRAKDRPGYKLGHAINLGFVSAGLTLATITYLCYRAANRRRRQGLKTGKYDHLTSEEIHDMGDRSPYFTYQL
ncbi:putative transporter [Yarrowia sp. B02]|nr:putative transporter [Yarrowia sp. B02]